MTNQPNEKLIEAVARAMVTALGKDPDEQTSWDNGWLTSGPRWQAMRDEALKQIAAFNAIRDFHRMTGRQF